MRGRELALNDVDRHLRNVGADLHLARAELLLAASMLQGEKRDHALKLAEIIEGTQDRVRYLRNGEGEVVDLKLPHVSER